MWTMARVDSTDLANAHKRQRRTYPISTVFPGDSISVLFDESITNGFRVGHKIIDTLIQTVNDSLKKTV